MAKKVGREILALTLIIESFGNNFFLLGKSKF